MSRVMDVDLHSRELPVLHLLLFNHHAPAGDSLEREDKIVVNTEVNTERVWDKADFTVKVHSVMAKPLREISASHQSQTS